ncbi:threonine--tRNA ligase [Acinetobacter lactucae]|uniref:threonine--tRNA ligase n=1 Tax=Acinetobacter lactucae TaxID=1785128 RepID=UPI001580001A|nr:threonine--tRNA ligase [Acinetobacter lactucae]NUF38378.1 threonine--tRNA ligase [Acinetobacter lactucae]
MNIQLVLLGTSYQLELPQPLSIAEILAHHKPHGYKKAFLAKVDQHYVDFNHLITDDCHIELLHLNDVTTLNILRHSYAYLLAQAVQQLYPLAQSVEYQITEHGLYFDFADTPHFNPEDIQKIELKMNEWVQQNVEIHTQIISKQHAIHQFQHQKFKLQVLQKIPDKTNFYLVKQQNFSDVYFYPLVSNSALLENFKITNISGAYWQGDANQPMLQRIYLTCWAEQKQLKYYLKQQEEAAKRDHRKLAQQLDLLHFDDKAPGAVFWHAKGWKLFQLLTDYLRQQQDDAGYIEVNTPDVMDRELWEISGHWQNYRQNMFITQTEDHRVYALKPMSCPGSVCLYAHKLRSYRDLPLRMAEFGKVHRYEPSGSLHGLMRVRHFTQDDAHIFCTENQLLSECKDTISLIYKIYQQFGFNDVSIKLSTRPDHRVGTEEIWDFLENTLKQSLEQLDISYTLNIGEGAFYGPKLEFTLKDAIGREWQCGTIQVDLNLPERFDIHYIDENNQKQRPVMLHRALFGSLERFIGILIEHYMGHFPFLLAPVQIAILPITDAQHVYAQQVQQLLKQYGFRATLDLSQTKLNYKIRENTLQKVPYLIIIGEQEMQQSCVRIRLQNGEDLGEVQFDELFNFFKTYLMHLDN